MVDEGGSQRPFLGPSLCNPWPNPIQRRSTRIEERYFLGIRAAGNRPSADLAHTRFLAAAAFGRLRTARLADLPSLFPPRTSEVRCTVNGALPRLCKV